MNLFTKREREQRRSLRIICLLTNHLGTILFVTNQEENGKAYVKEKFRIFLRSRWYEKGNWLNGKDNNGLGCWDHERWLCAWLSKLGHTFCSFDGAGSGRKVSKCFLLGAAPPFQWRRFDPTSGYRREWVSLPR